MKTSSVSFWLSVSAISMLAVLSMPGVASGAVGPDDDPQDRRERRNDRNERAKDRREQVQDRNERVDDRRERVDDRRERVDDDRRERVDDRQERRQDRWEDTWRERHSRFERWEDWREIRGAVVGARIMLGMIFSTLPSDHVVVVIDGRKYYVHEHVFFTEVRRSGARSYEVVRAPVGATVTILPAGHKTIEVGGATYYVLDDVYYQPSGTSYVVVAKP